MNFMFHVIPMPHREAMEVLLEYNSLRAGHYISQSSVVVCYLLSVI